VLWLLGIKAATNSSSVAFWVLIVAGISLAAGIAGGVLGYRFYQQRATAKAAFLWCLPALPVLFSISVLGVTYL
jgi:hypothetical protein